VAQASPISLTCHIVLLWQNDGTGNSADELSYLTVPFTVRLYNHSSSALISTAEREHSLCRKLPNIEVFYVYHFALARGFRPMQIRI